MKLARDTWLTLQYEVGKLLHSPVTIAASLLQPVTFLIFFTPFLKGALHVPSYGTAFQIYVPLLYCSMGLFGGLFAGLTLLAMMRQGVITRWRVTPLSRVGLLLGRELAFATLIAVQVIMITVAAVILGLRVPPGNVLLAVLVLVITVLFGVSVSFALAILVPSEATLAYLTNGVAQPLSLLAGVLIPLTVAPLWVKDVALWNPFAWAAKGLTAIFAGSPGAPAVWEAFAILGGLTVVAVVLSSRLFSREIA